MDRTEAKAIIEKHARFMQWDMQLQKWEIEISLDVIDGGDRAECAADNSYTRALITIDYTKADTEADLLASLRHELIHVLHAPFETFRRAVRQLVDDENAWHAVDHVYEAAAEQTRSAIENMLRLGYGIKPGRRDEYVAPVVNPYESEAIS